MIPAISSYASRPIAVSVLVCTKPNLQHCELHNMMAVAPGGMLRSNRKQEQDPHLGLEDNEEILISQVH